MRKIDVRPTLPLILSIALGTAAVLMVRNYITGEKKAMKKGLEPVRVVVARRNIPANEPLEVEWVAARPVPRKFVHANAIYPEEVNTPVRRVCYIAQLVLSGDAEKEDAKLQLLRGIEQLSQVLTDHDSRALLTDASDEVLDGQYYQALKALRGLLPREERLLAAARV